MASDAADSEIRGALQTRLPTEHAVPPAEDNGAQQASPAPDDEATAGDQPRIQEATVEALRPHAAPQELFPDVMDSSGSGLPLKHPHAASHELPPDVLAPAGFRLPMDQAVPSADDSLAQQAAKTADTGTPGEDQPADVVTISMTPRSPGDLDPMQPNFFQAMAGSAEMQAVPTANDGGTGGPLTAHDARQDDTTTTLVPSPAPEQATTHDDSPKPHFRNTIGDDTHLIKLEAKTFLTRDSPSPPSDEPPVSAGDTTAEALY